MSEIIAAEVSDMTGAAALPRANGELVFAAPWQGRAFGTAVALVREMGLDWEEFRGRLIVAIADDGERPYYDSWVAALESFVVDHGLASPDEVADRAARAEA